MLIENEIRMSNTFLAPGTDDPDERIRSIPERQPEQEQDMDTGGVPQQLEKFCQNIQLPLLQVFVCAVNLFLDRKSVV